MPSQLQHRTMMLVATVFGVLVLIGFAYGLAGTSLASDSTTIPTGRLDVDGVTYNFSATTCTVTESDFLAAGSGRIDDQTFWVSASGDGVDLAVGPESEVQQPDDGQLWLSSVESVQWVADDRAVTASAVMTDERRTDSRHFRGALVVECPAAGGGQQAHG